MVLGEYGGQLASVEWVFSPRGADGRPVGLFNRQTGDIHKEVAAYWRRYDISHILATRAKALVPQLRGKIHVIVGTEDTFHLDGSVRLLEAHIQPLGYQAKFTYLEGRTHFNFYAAGLWTRIGMQMYEVARPGSRWKPATTPDPSTTLAK